MISIHLIEKMFEVTNPTVYTHDTPFQNRFANCLFSCGENKTSNLQFLVI